MSLGYDLILVPKLKRSTCDTDVKLHMFEASCHDGGTSELG